MTSILGKPDALVKIQPIILSDQSKVYDVCIPAVVLNAVTESDATDFVIALHKLVEKHTNNFVDYVENSPRRQ